MDTPDDETERAADLSTLSDDTRRMGEALAGEVARRRSEQARIRDGVVRWEVIPVDPTPGSPWTMPDGWEPFGVAPSGRILCRRPVQ